MSFHIDPLFPGDVYESAVRLGTDIATNAGRQEDILAVMSEGWDTALSLGWTALTVPEEAGGFGSGYKELAAVVEGMGHTGGALPVANLCYAVPRVLAASESLLAKKMLGEIAEGATRVVIANESGAVPSLEEKGGQFALTGTVHAVEIGSTPSTVLVSAQTAAQEVVLAAVPTGRPGVSMKSYLRMDNRVVADFDLNNVALAEDEILLRGDAVTKAQRDTESFGIIFTAVESVAAMGRMLTETIDYLKNRQQFGAVLSSFQVLRHGVADLYVDYESLKAQVQAIVNDTEDDRIDARRCSLLMISIAQLGRRFGERVIQLHGGMGMTEEMLASRLAKRVIFAGFERGGEGRHLTLAAEATFCEEQGK